MKNQYPLQLEKQYAALTRKWFKDFSQKLATEIRIEMQKEIEQCNLRQDGLLDFLERMRGKFQSFLASGRILKMVESSHALFDAWTKAKVSSQFEKIKKRSGVSIAVNPFLTEKSMASTVMKKAIERNVLLIQSLGSEYLSTVSQTIRTGFQSGLGSREIGKQLADLTSVSQNRAEFWARDQAGKAMADLTKTRQTEAGILGYIWRTNRDGSVRDNHAEHEGKYFTWKEGAPGLTAPGARHPGEDYQCRCWAEPAAGAEDEDTQTEKAEAYAQMADFQYAAEEQNAGGFGSQESLIRRFTGN
jgi:SPP1 gp7 family putative phage head morphogenesis protein